jgi:hypothetical protein
MESRAMITKIVGRFVIGFDGQDGPDELAMLVESGTTVIHCPLVLARYGTLLFNTSGANVKTVIINGRTVMRDGVIPGVDVLDMRQRAQDYFEKLQAAYPERAYQHHSVADLFPTSFRVIKR